MKKALTVITVLTLLLGSATSNAELIKAFFKSPQWSPQYSGSIIFDSDQMELIPLLDHTPQGDFAYHLSASNYVADMDLYVNGQLYDFGGDVSGGILFETAGFGYLGINGPNGTRVLIEFSQFDIPYMLASLWNADLIDDIILGLPQYNVSEFDFTLPTGERRISGGSPFHMVTRVPEPGTFSLLALGIVAAAFSRRRKA